MMHNPETTKLDPEDPWNLVPQHLRGGLYRYLRYQIPPGGFLTAVLENDLRESFSRADENSRRGLFDLVRFLYNHVPATCWGSPERVASWLAAEPRNVD